MCACSSHPTAVHPHPPNTHTLLPPVLGTKYVMHTWYTARNDRHMQTACDELCLKVCIQLQIRKKYMKINLPYDKNF